MKKYVIFLLLAFVVQSVSARNLMAKLGYAAFYAPGQGPYIETYLSVSGNSVHYKSLNNGKYQAAIEISLIFSQNNEVKYFDKYNLLSPEVDDTLKTAYNFLDQQRIPLPNGTYQFELKIRDKSEGSKEFTTKENVILDFHPNVIAISDLELLDSYKAAAPEKENKLSKGGFDLVPMVDNFYPASNSVLKFYTEVYNTTAVLGNEGFIFNYVIESYESHQVHSNFSRIQRMQAKEVNAIIKEIDIAELPSGNYNLIVEVRNRNNELLASKDHFFQRSKPVSLAANGLGNGDVSNTFVSQYNNVDTLVDYIKCLIPISGVNDSRIADNLIDLKDKDAMQRFLYDFWERRNKENPYEAWKTYRAEVEKVNAEFSTQYRKGYETDRGRVYLHYGPPNQMSKNYNEPNTYPYEIWQYYKIENQSNRKFVFCNKEMATNDFSLIHSNANGEINDPQWQLKIAQRTELNSDYDKTNTRDYYGKRVNDQFKNPR